MPERAAGYEPVRNPQGNDVCLREVVVTSNTVADPTWLAATHVLCMRPLPCDNPNHKPDPHTSKEHHSA